MGMYTELNLILSIKEDAPEDVIETLKRMTSGEDLDNPLPSAASGHRFFSMSRSKWMLRSSSYYFVPLATFRLDYDDIGRQYYLTGRCDLKNYEDEIDAFIEWLTPYIDAEDGDFLGHKRYEEEDRPTLLIHPNIWETV